ALKLANDLSAQDDIRRSLESGRERGAQIFQEFHERRVALGDEAVARFEVFARVGENEIENAPLFIFEQRFEGEARLSKMPIKQPDSLREVGRIEGAFQLIEHGIELLLLVELTNRAGAVVFAHVEHRVTERVRFAG